MDSSILNYIQYVTPPSWDLFLSWFSLIGNFELITFLIILVLILFYKKTYPVIFGLFWYGTGLIIEVILKKFWIHSPPPISLGRTIEIFSVPHIQFETAYSFPSGHAYRATFLFIFATLYFLKNKNYPYVLVSCILLLIMLFSRVSLAEHWPSDVIGGVILSILTASLAIRFMGHKQ